MTSDANAKLPTDAACPICSMSHAPGRWCSAPYERSPLAAEINELPERLRSWIHHLETDADPAGTLRENFVLREAVAALGAKVEEAEARRDRLVEAGRALRDYLAWTDGGRNYSALRKHDTEAAFCAAFDEALADIEKEGTHGR